MGVINWETLQIWCTVEEKGFELKKNIYLSISSGYRYALETSNGI